MFQSLSFEHLLKNKSEGVAHAILRLKKTNQGVHNEKIHIKRLII